MKVDKSTVLELLREHGDDDKVSRAQDELPEQVDTDRHRDLLASYGLDEAGLGAKTSGTGTGSGIGSGLGGNLASEPEPVIDRD